MFELMESHADVEYTIRASYLEVYNEKVCVVTFLKSMYKSEVRLAEKSDDQIYW